MKIEVSCYAGYRGEQTPRSFCLNETCLQVVEVIDQWLAPDHRYFKVRAEDGHTYILRHNPHGKGWELSYFDAQPKVPKN